MRYCTIIWLSLLLVLTTHSHRTFGHPGSINLFVFPDTNQIYALELFEFSYFTPQSGPGSELVTDSVGFAVSSTVNGVNIGSKLTVDVVQDLAFWDGSGLADSSATVRMIAPTEDTQMTPVNSPVAEYNINEGTGIQMGMDWGTYDGTSFWETHAPKFLNLPVGQTPVPGIYGVSVQVHSPDHVSSDPFLIPIIYDPDQMWTINDYENGIQRLRIATAGQFVADVNQDGRVEADDVDSLVSAIVAGGTDLTFDLTGDGVVNTRDLLLWREKAGDARLANPGIYRPGDANLDGFVDVTDLNIWNANKFDQVAAWSKGDFNADGVVDVTDLNIWNANKFTASDQTSAVAVPEPSYGTAWWIVLLGCLRCLRVRQ